MTQLLTACATHSHQTNSIPPLLGQPVYVVEDIDHLAVTPEMESFLDTYAGLDARQDKRAWNLVWATTDRNVLPFEYDPATSLSSAETFATGTGNCLSFSNMIVAMARNRGLQAWFQEVAIPPTFSSANNTVLISMHVNAVLKGMNGSWIVDISGQSDGVSRRITRISDVEALAQLYNNLGADAITENNLSKAYAYLLKAIETAPTLSFVWSNLGVVYNRNEQIEDAQFAYLKSLNLESDNAIASNNLYMIYQQEGNFDAARKLQSKVDRHRRKNPYYLYFLSGQAYDEGRYDESSKMLLKAIRLNEKEYRFHYDLARVQVIGGDLDAARASLDRAVELAPDRSPVGQASVENLPPLPK